MLACTLLDCRDSGGRSFGASGSGLGWVHCPPQFVEVLKPRKSRGGYVGNATGFRCYGIISILTVKYHIYLKGGLWGEG